MFGFRACLQSLLFVSLAFLLLSGGDAWALGSTPVTVVNPATNPALTSSVDDPGRIPYQATHHFSNSDCNLAFQCLFTFPTIPAGKRLVAQHITVDAALSSGTVVQARFVIGGSALGSIFFVPVMGNATNFGTAASGDQPVLFYVDSGSSFETVMITDGAFANVPAEGGPVVLMTVTGYLLDCTVSTCAAIAP